MKYLLVYEHLERGGIETLIVRIGNWLVKNNHEVLLYVERAGAMSELLDSKINVIIPENKFTYILSPKKIVDLLGNKQIDCIYTFGPKSCLTGGIIYSSLNNRNKINFFSGIYHPREFNTKGRITLKGLIFLNFFKNYLQKGTHVFMSKSVKQRIQNTAKFSFDDSIVWPLAINLPEKTFNGKPRKLKIVSIGRYVEFKNYNLYMFNVVKDLANAGFEVTWEVYGHGPLKEKMLKLSSQKEFEGRTKVFGGIEYDKIPSVLEDALVFVGMGTALLEAGSYGVPCIPSIGYSNSPYSYGYLYDLPYYACGEKLETEPNISIASLIEELYNCDSSEYEQHRLKHIKYVAEYGMDALMSKFIEFTSKEDIRLKVVKYPRFFSYAYILVSSYYNFRHKLALRKRWGHVKNILVNKRTN